ncbi:MAG: dTMP kinase [Polyangiaceae bacterium]
MEGNFYVLEGIDGSGTTTQVERLCAWFRGLGLAAKGTREPTGGPIGSMIRQVLTHRLVVPGVTGPRPPGWRTMAALFAADRLDHLDSEILPNLHDGVNIVSDRYDLSSLAYQSVTSDEGHAEEAIAWIRSLNAYARRPDLTIILDVPASVAAERRNHRGGTAELFETDDLQSRLAEAYLKAELLLPGDEVVHIDATAPIDEVTARVIGAVKAFRERGRANASSGPRSRV